MLMKSHRTHYPTHIVECLIALMSSLHRSSTSTRSGPRSALPTDTRPHHASDRRSTVPAAARPGERTALPACTTARAPGNGHSHSPRLCALTEPIPIHRAALLVNKARAALPCRWTSRQIPNRADEAVADDLEAGGLRRTPVPSARPMPAQIRCDFSNPKFFRSEK